VLCGQKTGFFLDQRDNRAMVEELANGRSVLNLFAYTGGFSLYAARGGAADVVSVDSSKAALKTAVFHFQLNNHHPAIAKCKHSTIIGDVFEVLRNMKRKGQQFSMVIIDPPSFAKQKSERDTAMAAYRRLIRMGLELLQPGGTLVAASCSSRILADEFFGLVHEAGRENGRFLQEISRTTHALDHPINFSEGAYLKCLFAMTT
jgi:23S rRNA (cytosine1962-C5)-methyltransferase